MIMQHIKSARRPFLAGLAALAVSGCGAQSFFKKIDTPPNLYRLTPKSTFGDDLKPVNWQLVVDIPVAPAGINTQRVALMRSPIQVEYYANSNWTDRAPLMFQGLIVESFENSQMITSVGRQSVGLRSDFVLLVDMREFQMEYFDGAVEPSAHVRVNCKLVEMPDRLIVANESFEAIEVSRSDTMLDIVDAMDLALGKVLKGIVRWTLTVGEAYRPQNQS
jgi:cholesterol transport system auxiliary component